MAPPATTGPGQVQGHPIPLPGGGPGPHKTKTAGDSAAERKRRILQMALVAGGALLLVGLVVAIALVLSGSGNERGDLTGFSGTPGDYLPSEVDGRAVRTNAPVLEEISTRFLEARGLQGAGFELATAMLPSGPRQPPQVVLIAVGGDGADGLMDSFAGDQKVSADERTEVAGQDVRLIRVENDEFPEVWTAIASPREDLAVVVISFSGGRDGAESMMSAALETGKQ